MKLLIEKCIYGGAGLARADGKTIFAPYTLPGEEVEAHVTEDKRSFANAELDHVVQPSSYRTNPPCEYFGQCGGCQYQHAAYPYQVEIKQSILRETLERARLTDLPEILPVHAEPFGYRNRVRLHIQAQPFAIGYKRRASHQNLPIGHCSIAAPVLEQAIAALHRIGSAFEIGKDFSEVEIFTNDAQSELLLSLWARQRGRDVSEKLTRLCIALREQTPALSGAAVFFTDPRKQIEQQLAQWGPQTLTYHAAKRAYRVSIGSFFQVNRFLVDRLVELVCPERSGISAWDLYAGAGLFSKALAESFESVTAVEGAPSSSKDLQQNLAATHHRKVNASTLQFLRQQSRHNIPAPELIVVDPPRAGLGSEVTSLLTKVRAQTIVYVSCDPATLSRDLHALVESGYRLRTMHMVDLFPQTFHLESVTMLSLD